MKLDSWESADAFAINVDVDEEEVRVGILALKSRQGRTLSLGKWRVVLPQEARGLRTAILLTETTLQIE